MRTYCLVRLVVVVGILAALCGCSSDGLARFTRLGQGDSGRQAFGGRPDLLHGRYGKGNKAPASPFGKCKDGSYSLTTKDKPGRRRGWYKVVVTTKYPGGPEKPVEIPDKYTDASKTDLSVEVKSGGGDYDLKLKSK